MSPASLIRSYTINVAFYVTFIPANRSEQLSSGSRLAADLSPCQALPRRPATTSHCLPRRVRRQGTQMRCAKCFSKMIPRQIACMEVLDVFDARTCRPSYSRRREILFTGSTHRPTGDHRSVSNRDRPAQKLWSDRRPA